MESPVRSIRFIHNAIRKETETLESAIAQLAAEDVTGAEECARRQAFLYDVVKVHEDGEEDSLFPMIDELIYPVSAPYLLDHRADQLHMLETIQSFKRLAATRDAGERAQLLRHLSRQAIIFNAATTLHIRKEEDILVPLVEGRISIEEQSAMAKKAMGRASPQQMQAMFPWVLKAQTPDDQEAFLRGMMESMPPEVFSMMARRAAEALSASEWAEITRRLPEAA